MKEEYKSHTLVELRELAEKYGCRLFEARGDQLLLDIDSASVEADAEPVQALSYVYEAWKAKHEQLLKLLDEKFIIEGDEHWASRRGKLHVCITLGVLIERYAAIALQAALGSDPRREILAVFEAMTSTEDTRSLFKPKAVELTPVDDDDVDLPF